VWIPELQLGEKEIQSNAFKKSKNMSSNISFNEKSTLLCSSNNIFKFWNRIRKLFLKQFQNI